MNIILIGDCLIGKLYLGYYVGFLKKWVEM